MRDEREMSLQIIWKSAVSTDFSDTHVSNLIQLRYDSSEALRPLEVAARNAGEFFVEGISEHKGLTLRKT